MQTRASSFAMLSHAGKVRRANEDACGSRPDLGAYVVCDGMGGAAAGEVASRLAVDAFLAAIAASPASRGLQERLAGAVAPANEAVFQHSRQSRHLHGMGTTLVALLLDQTPPGTAVGLAHVGDSRCYRLRRGILVQLTEDHSLVAEQMRAGILSSMQAEVSPIRNIITRAVGSQPDVEAEIAVHAAEPGDLYLLASDGLTRELSDVQIAAILSRSMTAKSSELEPACHALVDAANAAGGGDNITVILLKIAESAT